LLAARDSPQLLARLFVVLPQVTRNGVIVEGRLAYKLTTGTSPNPRWLVKFDKGKDEELYEHVFGTVLRKADSSIDASGKSKPNHNNNNSKQKSSSNTAGSSGTSSASETEGQAAAAGNKKSVTFSQESSPVDDGSAEGEDGKSALVLTREERSKRRQTKGHDDYGHNHNNHKRSRPNSSKSNKKARRENNTDEIIKVPMLTGTLYLYRGLHRRAEFVWKI
jgi:hypothetical protein